MSTGGGREIRAGKAYVELGLRNRLKSGLNRAAAMLRTFSATVTSIGARLAGLGAAITAPLLLAVRTATQLGDALLNSAKRAGFSVEAFSEYQYAMEQSGGSAADLEAGILSMQKVIAKAGRGGAVANKALETLGLSFAELEKMSPEKQFETIADRIMAIENPTERAALAFQLFGTFGHKLLPLFQRGAKDIEELRKRARELGLVMSEEDATALAKLGNLMNDVWHQIKAIQVAIAAALAPALTELANRITRVLAVVINLIKKNREVVLTVAKIGAALLLAGVLFLSVGAAASAMAWALSGIVTIGAAIGAVFSFIAAAVASILTPLGAVIAATAALGVVIVYFSGMGAAALRWLMDAFSNLWRHTQGVLNGIADALMAGELMLAAQILWQGIKVAWLEGTRDIKVMWIQFKLIALGVFDSIYFGAARMFQKLVFEASKAAFKMAAMMHEHLGIGNMTPEMADMAIFALDVAQGVAEDKINQLEEQVRRERLEGAMEDAKATDEEIREAKRKLEELKEEARRKREEQENMPEPPLPSPHAFPGFEGLALGLQNGAAAIGAFGAAGGRLGMATPGDAFRQMNGHLENIEDDIAEVADAARNQALVFNP